MLPYDKSVRLLGVFAFLTAFCEALSFYAASLYAYALTGSVLAVSVVMTATAIAETVGAVLGGTLADRLDRRLVAALGGLAGTLLLASLGLGVGIVGARGIFGIAAASLLLSVFVLAGVRGRFGGADRAASESPLAGFA